MAASDIMEYFMQTTYAYLGLCQTPTMEFNMKVMAKSRELFLLFAKCSIVDVWQRPKYISEVCFLLLLGPLQPGVALLSPPENIRKPKGFLMFSWDIEKQPRAVMC